MEISGLLARNNQLEATVESLTTSITSLGEALAQSNVLVSDGDLHGRLSETIGKCLCPVSNNGEATSTRRVAAVNPQSELSLPINFFIRPCPVFSVLPLLENDLAEKLKNPVPVSGINYKELIDILDAALVFSAYVKVANPSISLQRVQHYFHLALTIMDRNRLKSYYATLFHSKLTRQPTLFINDNIPFLQVGGAGTHYGDARPLPLSHTSSHAPTIFKRAEPFVITAAPLQKVPPVWAARLEGTWFDITDLEMFLKAKQVSLHRCQRAHNQSKSACPKGSVSLQQFVQGTFMNLAVSLLPFMSNMNSASSVLGNPLDLNDKTSKMRYSHVSVCSLEFRTSNLVAKSLNMLIYYYLALRYALWQSWGMYQWKTRLTCCGAKISIIAQA